MELLLICLVAAAASMLTFFSGFGLGTLLSPFMMLFFPPETAIALTGIVHFLNNIFKITLVYRHINTGIALTFGTAALAGSYLGARGLLMLSGQTHVIASYEWLGRDCVITPLKLLIASLMLLFVFMESNGKMKEISFGKRAMLPGGLISGFFGGLSGNQGALRSMFLLKSGLGKEAYIATGIMIACMVDITRLGVYFSQAGQTDIVSNAGLLAAAVLSAFAGAWYGNRKLKKMTLESVQRIVSVMLFLLAAALAAGII